MSYPSRLLGDQHDVEAFDCQVESLNTWLKREARRAHRSDTARTFVWTETSTSANVLGYFSIAPTIGLRAELTAGQAGGVSFDIPGYLLARLALDTSLHGQGLGTELLLDAIGRMVKAAENYAGRLIVVDALNQNAAAFYQHHEFTPVKDNPNRLIVKIATARKAMGLPPR